MVGVYSVLVCVVMCSGLAVIVLLWKLPWLVWCGVVVMCSDGRYSLY